MSSKWHRKKNRLAATQFERDLQGTPDDTTKNIVTSGTMGGGEDQVFERKLTKEEKKAIAKAKREEEKSPNVQETR